MDIHLNSVTLHTQNALGEPSMEQEEQSLSVDSQAEHEGTILLQLLKFKTQLLDVVEELHIRRDAETRFEGHTSKLVLEKQELQWEKESLQNQLETATKQHTSSLSEVKNQFQAKFRSSEEEKGRNQVAAELKDKEINHLKDELKSLQLLKYNLEKKCSELEQKLSLQSRTKESHVKQLEEVEKRFSALSRNCGVLKQAHHKLLQSVDEAMRINKKLTCTNEKLEETILSLKTELEEEHNKVIKAKMTLRGNSSCSIQTGKEQLLRQLHHKLHLETEMNKKLQDEVDAERANKKDVMRSLQQTQKLLLNQTQRVKKAELELQSQREMFQALKKEHEVVREKSKAAENKVVQVMECLASSKTSWDKEKEHFLDRIKREQEVVQAARDAYEDLNEQHTELTSHAQFQNQQIKPLEMETSSKMISAPTSWGSPSVEDEETSMELTSSFNVALNSTASTKEETPKQAENISPVLPTVHNLSNIANVNRTENGQLNKIDANSEAFDLLTDVLGVKENGCVDTLAAPCSLSSSGIGNLDISVKEQSNKYDGRQTENMDEDAVNTNDEIVGKETSQRTDDNSRESVKNPQINEDLETGANGGADANGRGQTSETPISAQTTADIKERHVLEVNESLDVGLPVSVCEPSDCSTSRPQKDSDSSLPNDTSEEKEGESLCSDDPQTVIEEPKSALIPTFQRTDEEMMDGLRFKITPLQLPAPPDDIGQTTECTSNQTQTSISCDFSTEIELTREANGTSEEGPIGKKLSGPKVCPNDPERKDCLAADNPFRKTRILSDPQEKPASGNEQTQDAVDAVQRESVVKRGEERINQLKKTDASKHLKSTSSVNQEEAKGLIFPNEANLLADPDKSSLFCKMASFNWCTVERKPFNSEVSNLHQYIQENQLSEQSSTESSEFSSRTLSTIPTFVKSKQSKAPLVIMKASDLLNSSSGFGTAASWRRNQQGVCEGAAAGRETTAADTETCSLPAVTSGLPSSLSSSRRSHPSWSSSRQSKSSSALQSDWETPCSQEREEQQSSFRAHISKIEQFLNSERLRLPKRQRSDD